MKKKPKFLTKKTIFERTILYIRQIVPSLFISMKRLVFVLILLLKCLAILGQPIDKSYINNSINKTRSLTKKSISIESVKAYPRLGYKTSIKENREFVYKLSKNTGLDTNLIWKKIKICSGNDSLSYKYLIPEVFWDIKKDSVRKVIISTIKKKEATVITGWYIYVYFYIEKSRFRHETYTETDEKGNVEKFFLIQ